MSDSFVNQKTKNEHFFIEDIKVVAFDCDGVMFDTKNANIAYYNKILEQFNKPEMTLEQIEFIHVHTVDESIEHLFEKNPDIINEANNFRKKISYLPFLSIMQIEPHLKHVLQILRPEYKTAIATNRTDTMQQVLKENKIEQYFDLVVCSLDVERPKPFPDPLLKIIDHFQISPKQLIYIGDSEVDEIAAKRAGVYFIAYQNNFISADFHINSLQEIKDIFS